MASNQIKDLFDKDINRPINGVVKVSQNDDESIRQELEEYVITRELQRHFADFFESYARAIDTPTDRVGVWISGFFGSGKSHFLKMLSYLLANVEVSGKRPIDFFDGKIKDPLAYSNMKRACAVPTETILFNIDDKASQWKEGATAKTALLRAFARVFYEHRGFYGANLNLARLEEFIDEQGKTAAFREAFEQETGVAWVENRDSAAFYEDDIVNVLMQVMGWSEEQARRQFDRVDDEALAPDDLARQIDAYAQRRADECGGDFRLLFMVDEVGQFIGADVNLMLNLQTIVEDLGARCRGRVWVMVTSQEAIDEVTKVAGNDFSKIQGRFNTRLSLSSSSVDEVIKQRVLGKTEPADAVLARTYEEQSAVLKNLFTFEGSQSDLIGYADARDFCESYPFVRYQFKIMANVLAEIRRHGNAGKHLSGGERSMLSGFQESAQRVQDREVGALVPFWRFYDSLEAFLEHDIRQVIERCRRAAEDEAGIEPIDVEVLKTLYLIRYINDVKPTVNNIALLVVDEIAVDKVAMRERVAESLARLVRENYVSRSGDTYHFLTNEEQDIAREIRSTQIDSASIAKAIGERIFSGLFTARKLRKDGNDFAFDCYIDDALNGNENGGMKLNVITLANPLAQADDAELMLRSSGQALVVLGGAADAGGYYEVLEDATRIRKYVKTKNVQQLPRSTQRIIEDKQKEAASCEREANELIEQAIVSARVAVDGRMVELRAPNTKQKLEGALGHLVRAVYTKADYIGAPVSGKDEIVRILAAREQESLAAVGGPNDRATEEMAQFLDAQAASMQPTALSDVKSRYRKPPFGWREDDIVATVARLVAAQRAEITRMGASIAASDPKLVDYLTKSNEADKVRIARREKIDEHLLKSMRIILRDFPGVSSVPEDEDGVAACARKALSELNERCKSLRSNEYAHTPYPGRDTVEQGVQLTGDLLEHGKDARSLFSAMNEQEDELLDFVEDFESVEGFFPNQQRLFDDALKVDALMAKEAAYLEGDDAALAAWEEIKKVLGAAEPWSSIPLLNGWTETVRKAHAKVLNERKADLLDRIEEVRGEVERYADGKGEGAASVVSALSEKLVSSREEVNAAQDVTSLEAVKNRLDDQRDREFGNIDDAEAAAQAPSPSAAKAAGAVSYGVVGCPSGAAAGGASGASRDVTTLKRAELLPPERLMTPDDVERYVDAFKQKLLEAVAEGPIRLG